jgi:hypothetical protein
MLTFNDFVLGIFQLTYTVGFFLGSYIEPLEEFFTARTEITDDVDPVRRCLIAFVDMYGSKTLGVISLFLHVYLLVSFLIGLLFMYQSRHKSYRYVKNHMQNFCNEQLFHKVQFLIGILNFGTSLSIYHAYRFVSSATSDKIHSIVIYYFIYFIVIPNLDLLITWKILAVVKRTSRKRLFNLCAYLTVLILLNVEWASKMTGVLLFMAIIHHFVYSIILFFNLGYFITCMCKSNSDTAMPVELRVLRAIKIRSSD